MIGGGAPSAFTSPTTTENEHDVPIKENPKTLYCKLLSNFPAENDLEKDTWAELSIPSKHTHTHKYS